MPNRIPPAIFTTLRLGAMALALAAAGLAIFSVSQPAFETRWIAEIENNTLLERGTGWPIVACALGIVGATLLYGLDRMRATKWAMVVVALGAVILGTTVYQVTGGRDAVQGGDSVLVLFATPYSSPATGLRAAEAAGMLAGIAGLFLALLSRSASKTGSTPPRSATSLG